MKYEFKEGDFVETVDGDIGYISSICHCNMCKERGFYEPEVKYKNRTDYITYYEAKNGFGYKRIGKYDFTTKPKQPKMIDNLLYVKLDQEDIINKINEVIDRVNEIGEK